MQHYCGIDFHSNNHVVVIVNEEDKRVFEKRLSNDLSQTLKVMGIFGNDTMTIVEVTV